MTIVFDTSASEGQDFAINDFTHAFVVGVGRYGLQRPDGKSPHADAIAPAARSALAMARWLIGERKTLCAPLGSLELLVSDPDYSVGGECTDPFGNVHQVDDPTIDNLQSAFDRWIDRLDLRPGNTALFFAAGHGVFDDQPYLLAEDYGANKRRAFEEMVALRDFFTGMITCAAGKQLFIADCCQEVNSDLLSQLSGTKGVDFVSATADDIKISERAMMYSTTMGTLAAADETGQSHFTKALITALNGEGARRGRDRKWHVSYQSLYDAIPVLAERQTGAPIRIRGVGELTGPLNLLTLETPPKVEVELVTDPNVALMDAEFSVQDRTGAECLTESRPMLAKIRCPLTAQNGYLARAEFHDNTPYRSTKEYFDVEPLMYPVPIPVPSRQDAGE